MELANELESVGAAIEPVGAVGACGDWRMDERDGRGWRRTGLRRRRGIVVM